jgi:uncharacterized integral membrane protein (TIGR00698 family)
MLLHRLPGLTAINPIMIAILIGMAVHNVVRTPKAAKDGIRVSMRTLLRLAIMLLGLQLTVTEMAAVGRTGILIIVLSLSATFLFTMWLGRLLEVNSKLAQLIGAGTSICGAAAVIATNTVTRARDEDVAYAIACVTVFGSLWMFLYPLFEQLLFLTPEGYGLWAGASIHEIAQVVAAGFQNGPQSGNFATIAKLTRVLLLAPIVFTLAFFRTRDENGAAPRASLPWFVLGFVVLVIVNSAIPLAPATKSAAASITSFLLAMALAGMGLETDLSRLKAKGSAPMLLGAGSAVFISMFSLALIELLS